MVLLVIAGFVAGNSTLAALVFNLSEMSAESRNLFQVGLLVSTLIVAGLLSPQLLRNVVSNVRRRTVSVDLLFLLGCLGAMGVSMISTLRGTGAVYFEVFSLLLVIYCLGAWVKQRTQRRVWTSLDAWSPTTHRCRVLDADGTWTSRVISEVRSGDTVQVPAGSMIPVDGEIVQGLAFVRESTLTGEPHVRSVAVGDNVIASSVLIDAPLTIRATADGTHRLIDRITSVVDATRLAPSRWQTQADQIARWFTPIVASVAITTFAVWLWNDDVSSASMVALSVLLVACPCAFGFATPVSIWVTLSRLASRSLVATRADVIERLASVDTVVFDKTGTLTVLEPQLNDVWIRTGSAYSREQLLALATAIESHSHHPIASVFIAGQHAPLNVESTEAIPAVGVRGRVELAGHWRDVEVGRLCELHRPCCDGELLTRVEQSLRPGQQAVAIRVDGDLEAAAIIAESTIDTLDEGIAQIESLGLAVKVFSGDQAARVRRLGIESVTSGMTPDDKVAAIDALRRQGRRVLFIGDGVNDAAAMCRADASISVADGSALAVEASDMSWHGHDLRNIPAAIQIAQRSVIRLRRSLLFAMSYNTIGMLIAATGWLHPVVAVLLMMGSSLTVVLHAADMTWENELSASRLPMKLTSPETDSPTDSLTSSSPLPSPLIQLTPNREQV
jgi:heavy metal translocating P-type ATPase